MLCVDVITIISNLIKKNLGANISNIFKCKSKCCNHITYYNCRSKNEFYNSWTKTVTPTVESPSNKKQKTD